MSASREMQVKVYQFRQELATMMAEAESRPVVVLSHNEPTAVLVSYREYQILRQHMYRIPVS